jgi:hypothetical protein
LTWIENKEVEGVTLEKQVNGREQALVNRCRRTRVP